ncbi:MAG TPA: hypothetical protein VN224_08870, partial [Xanthomonadales bacterium]|nr:hypothetical protein [Xanthomonadales bacterium]
VAIEALSEPARRLLQTLSLLQGGADYATLKEFNPHRPPHPEEVEAPCPPETSSGLRWMDADEKETAKIEFGEVKKARGAHVETLKGWEQSPDARAAATRFDETLTELERQGLLQYEHSLKRYDLHPVVRGVAAGRLAEKETSEIGRQVVDYFSNRPHDPWEQAETLEDVAPGIQVVATLTRMGRFEDAFTALDGALLAALDDNLMAFGEIQRLLRPLFPHGWDGAIALERDLDQCNVLLLLSRTFEFYDSDDGRVLRLAERAIRAAISSGFDYSIRNCLRAISRVLGANTKLAEAARIKALTLEFAEEAGDAHAIYSSLLSAYWTEIYTGAFERADALWSRLDPKRRSWGRFYRRGDPESARAEDLFRRDELTEATLAEIERFCREGRNRSDLIQYLGLRGEWHLSRGEASLAIAPVSEALHLCRKSGLDLSEFDAMLALARLRAGHPVDARSVTERLHETQSRQTALTVAELWQDLGEPALAIAAALRAHKAACGSGEPYVYRYSLDRADALLRKLGETPPEVPQHDPANDEVFDWENDVRAVIEKRRKEREDRKRRAAEREKTNRDE